MTPQALSKSNGRCFGAVPVLLALAFGFAAPASGQQPNESWRVSAGGQGADVGAEGGFLITNISAPDNNQDNISDEYVSLWGSGRSNGARYWILPTLTRFRIRAGQTRLLRDSEVTLTDHPPPLVTTLGFESHP